MATKKKTTVVKKKSARTKTKKAQGPAPTPSKFIGPAIVKPGKDRVTVDIVRSLVIEREAGETDAQLEARAVKAAYVKIKEMKTEFKDKAREGKYKL